MNIYVGRQINFKSETVQRMHFMAFLNADGTYNIYKNMYDGTTPKSVSRSVILHYIIQEGIIS